MRYILTSGCSFTKIGFFDPLKIKNGFIQEKHVNPKFYKWGDWLQEIYGKDYSIINLGSQTNDNVTISRTIYYWVNKLMSEGVNSTDISVIIQWSTPQRTNFYVPKEKTKNLKNSEYFGHTSHYLNGDKMYDSGVFYLTGGFNIQDASINFGLKDLLQEYIYYYSGGNGMENQTLAWLENWCNLKLFFEKHKIKNHYFSMCDILSESMQKTGFGFYAGLKSNEFERAVLDDKLIANTENDLCWLEQNELYKPYIDNLNLFENFWLYKTPTHKYGGQLEWTIKEYIKEDLIKYNEFNGHELDVTIYEECYQQNINERDYVRSGRWYGHTSSIMNRKFVIEELIPFLKYE